jgi:hypothetical protein
MKTQQQQFLAHFWSLADADSDARQQAACAIVVHLKKSQDVEVPNAPESDLQYALKRLVRGVSSSRGFARQGFATVLAEVLGTFRGVKLLEIFDMIIESTEVSQPRPPAIRQPGGVGADVAVRCCHRSKSQFGAKRRATSTLGACSGWWPCNALVA